MSHLQWLLCHVMKHTYPTIYFTLFVVCGVYLLLTQDQKPLWFNGMIWSQVLPAPPLDSILKSFPNTIAGGPGNTDVMPLPIIDEERQLCDLDWGK